MATIKILGVGGGGGGGAWWYASDTAGGGGGGQTTYLSSFAVSLGASYPVVVGGGGSGGVCNIYGSSYNGTQGGTTTFNTSTVSAIGGYPGTTAYVTPPTNYGQSGNGHAGGGPGGGGDGADCSGRNGGDGTAYTITGSSVYYAGGGAGRSAFADGTPGQGSVGQGGSPNGGSGAAGALIISYPTGSMSATGGSITTSGGDTIHTFTANGTLTVTDIATDLTKSLRYTVEAPISSPVQKSLGYHIAFGANDDQPASLVTSAYKWLTDTLYSAQQKYITRPYFTAKIIDDTIQPNAQLFSGTDLPGGQGSMVTAPDGTVFSVGVNGGALKVYSASDLNAVAGVWPASVTLNTTGDNFNNAANRYSINCSDYYHGSYRLTVWYFGNFLNNGSDLTLILQYSDDGGATWTKVTYTLSPGSLNNSTFEYLSVAAMKPVLGSDGLMKMGAFYIKTNGITYSSGFSGQHIYYAYGDTTNGVALDVKWSDNANSYDWVVQSLATFYKDGVHHCVLTGFRNIIDTAGVNANNSVWITSVLNLAQDTTLDLWSAPSAVIPSGSASSTNLNNFTNVCATLQDGIVYITVQASLVDSVAQSAQGASSKVVTTHTNYYLMRSDDGKGFSYPTTLVATDGTEFNNGSYASFIKQGGYWYLGGAGYLWQSTQNNIVADVTNDVLSYAISESAGSPSSMTLVIGNSNNAWVGSAPTNPGAAAIAKNRKVAIWQGYYNASGVGEAVPHSVYYIDDIKQIVSAKTNSASISCRDLFKKTKTTVSKFAYQSFGPVYFSDIFDGTYLNSWNQVKGTWTFNPTSGGLSSFLSLTAYDIAVESKIMLTNGNLNAYGHFMRVFFRATSPVSGAYWYFYGAYIDDNNWVRLEINALDNQSWAVTQCVAGTTTTLDSGTMPFTLNGSGVNYYGVYIRRYGYNKFNFMISNGNADAQGNELFQYNPATTSYVFKNSGTGEYDLSTIIQNNASWQHPFVVGLGTINNANVIFRYFTFTQFNQQNNLGAVLRRVARIASVFSFKESNTWRDNLYLPNYTGTFTVANRAMTIKPTNSAVANANTMSNGQIEYTAKMTLADPTQSGGFSFVFRQGLGIDNMRDEYRFHIIAATPSGGHTATFCRFERYSAGMGITYQFYNTPYDVSNNPTNIYTEGVRIDPTKWHTYKVVMIDGWFSAFVDDVMVASWNDNNTTGDYLTTGKWGFIADSNTSLTVKNIKAPTLWKPVPAFTYNPGDDADSTISALLTSLRIWLFSDLLGRFKTVFLGSSDPSTYTYQTQLTQQNVDASDKEYVSQVTVYGDGVSATARNTTIATGMPMREEVIVDYTITTVTDAQTRANNELTNALQYSDQFTPTQVINVGAELFDAVTVINTGANTSGVDSTTRVYSQDFETGGSNTKAKFGLTIETGNL